MIKRCELWNIASVHGDWEGRKVLVVVYVAKVLRWFKVHYILAMVSEPQVAMRVTLQIWQVVFASQTLLVFCFSLRKKAQYVIVSFAHNLGYKCPNGSCEAILDIYTSRPFQSDQEHFNARRFIPSNQALSFRESRRTPFSHFWECELHSHT